ncbi:MAG: peptidase M3, partial [Deltaproteobacteria bacterium]
TYRATIGGKVVDDAGIMDILKNSTDSERRRQAWEGYKKRGALVRDELLELVHLRNRAARKLGFSDYYSMRLRLQEQDPDKIRRIFDELEKQTTAPFAREMKKLRAALAKKFGITESDLKPWHFSDPFFQEAPGASGLDLDRLFEKTDPVKLAEDFYAGIGLDLSDVLKRSDLWPRDGKMPHAYCIDMNRAGDIRILANLTKTETQMSTLLHELGHAAYSKYISPKLPWLLREESHPFTTEAIAMLFGRLTRNPSWLAGMGLASNEKASELAEAFRHRLRLSMLIMARWTMVMVNFERELYRNPDQDLNALWWRLKKRFQLIDPPPRPEGAADWASKIHIAAWPAYYHNYMLGELMASQVTYAMAKEQGTTPEGLRWVGNARIGAWLKKKIFAPGKSLRWDDLLVKATGESLNPSYFVRQFVKGD